MTKKVLVLSATPRKGGNSDLLCDQFMRGAKETGNRDGLETFLYLTRFLTLQIVSASLLSFDFKTL